MQQTSEMATDVPPSRLRERLVLAAVAAATAAAEVAASLVAALLHLEASWLVAAHLAVMAALVVWLRRRARRGDDTRFGMILALATLVSGPIGATLALLLLPFAAHRRHDSHLLEAWYERIAQAVSVDTATRLSDDVATGRTLDRGAAAPLAFARVIEQGTLAERQAALGLIARKFHPDYAPALVAALKSPETVVRVQAAAVAARVRRDLQARVRATLADVAAAAADPVAALATASELDGAARSGLLDEGDRVRAAAAAARLRKAGAEALAGAVAASNPIPRGAALALEDELLAGGRYGEFRLARKRRRVAERGRFVIRRLRRAAAAPARAEAREA